MNKKEQKSLSIRTAEISCKLERISVLTEVMERALENEFEIESKKLVSLSYTINDYLREITSEFNKLEKDLTQLNKEQDEM